MFALGEPVGATRRAKPLMPSAEEIEQILHARLRVMAQGETLNASPAVRSLIEDGIPQLAQMAVAAGGPAARTTGSGRDPRGGLLTRFFSDAPREVKW